MNIFSRGVTLLQRPNFIPLVIVILFGVLASKGLIGEGYFNMHDDLQMMRQLSMEKCFLDGQIPCRWIPDMGYGFGYPLFNFYPPLPYLVGQLFRVIGYSFVDTVKIVFGLSFIASGITMYFLAKEFFSRFGGVVAAIFYIWAPYHAVDVYVRGAMNEAWALIWFPAILYFSYKLLAVQPKSKTKADFPFKYVIGLALTWFGLFTSHNLMVIVFAPFFAIWCGMWLLHSKNWRRVLHLAVSGAWSFGLAAFFTLPVLLEKDVVQTDSLVVGYYEYTAHFVSISQLLFSRFWGYGPSVWMTQDDRMSFQIGWFHWILPLIAGAILAFRFILKKKVNKVMMATAFMLLVGWFAAFLTHPRSTLIWQQFDPYQFVQFPWRFLTMVIFGFSFVTGYLMFILPKGIRYIAGTLAVILILVYGWNYFLPEYGKLGPLTDEEKFTGAAWELQQTAGIYDYLPNTAKTAPKAPMKNLAEFMEGTGEIIESEQGTDWVRFVYNTNEDSVLRIGLLEFPEWEVLVSGNELEEYVPETEEWGRVYIDVPAGTHEVNIQLKDTPPRTLGNLVSVGSWLILAAIVFHKRNTIFR